MLDVFIIRYSIQLNEAIVRVQMWFYRTMLPASWLLLLALICISSASIKTQTRRSIPVDVDDIMTREYTEFSVASGIMCAAATRASHLNCYNAPRCLTVLSFYGIRGPMTPGWTCKTGESSPQRIKKYLTIRDSY